MGDSADTAKANQEDSVFDRIGKNVTAAVTPKPKKPKKPKKKVVVKKKSTFDPVDAIDPLGVNPIAQRQRKTPKPQPKKTDWREDPGGGYVDTRSGRKMPLVRGPQEEKARIIVKDRRFPKPTRVAARKYLDAYERARQEQREWFTQAKDVERQQSMVYDPVRQARARRAAAVEEIPEKARRMIGQDRLDAFIETGRPLRDPGLIAQVRAMAEQVPALVGGLAADFAGGVEDRVTDPDFWKDPRNVLSFTPDNIAKRAAARAGEYAVREPEKTAELVAGKSLVNMLFHGDFSHPGAALLEAAVLPVPFLKGGPMVATSIGRAAAGARIAAKAGDVSQTGMQGLRLMAKSANMTRHERAALAQDVTVLNILRTSEGREALKAVVDARLPASVAAAFMEAADAQALTVHRQISEGLEQEIKELDALVASGKATDEDIALRKELGMLQRFGVEPDYYYNQLHEAGAGIPEWVRARYQREFPNLDWNFKFEGPQRAGPNFSAEAIDKRLASLIDPANAEKGLTVNPAVRRKGYQVLGAVSNKSWLARVNKVMPSKEERTYWATWYESFEPLFRQAFGDDADAIMRGFAASQANTSPAGGIGATLRVMDRLRRGEEVTAEGIGMIAYAVQDAVQGTPLESGMAAKLSDFTDALAQMNTRTWMGHSPVAGAPAPSDIWAGRDLGYVDPKFVGYLEREYGLKEGVDFVVDSPGAPQGIRYEQISKRYNEIADWLNAMEGGKGFDGHQWTPASVQALGWGAIQKAVNANPEDIGYALARNSYEVATEVTKGATGIGANLTVQQAMDLSQEFATDIRALVEDTPGVYLLPGDAMQFTTGGWDGGQNGAIQFRVIGERRSVQDFINRVALAFDQEYVQATRRTSSADAEPKSALIISSKAFDNETEKQRFFEALSEHSPESAPKRGAPKEKELQGYARHAPVDDTESIVIRTHKGASTGVKVDPFIQRYAAAIKKAEEATGIKVTTSHENLAMLVGGQHGAVNPLDSVAGAAGGRGAVDDQLASGIRTRLEARARDTRVRSSQVDPGSSVQAAADDIEGQIARVEAQIDALIKERVAELGGTSGFMATGGRAKGTGRKWEPAYDRRGKSKGAIGGRLGDYDEAESLRRATTAAKPYKTARENARDHAEWQLVDEAHPEYTRLSEQLESLREARELTYPEWARFSDDRRFLHGVHAINRNAREMPIPMGKSAVYISERTPLPTRILTHEFFGHYVDKQILDKFPAARRVFEEQTVGLSQLDKDELFAQWAEEYVLQGGGANLPAALRPALQTLAEEALKETAGYGGSAARRIYLPPEMEEVFDALHGYEKLTGDPYIPGRTTYAEAIESLDARVDSGIPISTDNATRAARFLKLNDKVQQIPGEARSRVTRATVERIADAISQSLMGEGRVARLGRNIMRTAPADMRVAKAAGRELEQESRRALQALHPAMKALPKEGTVKDVAHFWWAQLPESQRNIDGLRSVRARQAEEFDSIASGEMLTELQVGLDNVTDALKQAEWGSDEAFELMERSGQIRALISDLPQRMEDISRSIATIDLAITAAPKLEDEIIQAIGKLSASREAILVQAGAAGADLDRFANRRGILGTWLGHQPDGSEIYIGHRLGKVRGAQSTATPASVGVGKARTPEGLGRANQLALANTGRLRQSTHVAAEDFLAARTYEAALKQREDYGLMGVPFEGGRIPEGKMLVNPKGRLVPKAWKTDPFAGLTEANEEQVESLAKELVDGFVAPGGDSKAALRAQEEMLAAAKEQGIPLTDLRLVDEKVVTRYAQQFQPARTTNTALKAYDQAVNAMAASLIFVRAGYIPKNIAQNLIMAVPHQGAFFLMNAPRAAQLRADTTLWDLIATEIGSGATMALDKELTNVGKLERPTHWAVGKVTSIADNPIRISAFIHEAAAHGIIPKFTPYLREEDKLALANLLTNPEMRPTLNKIRAVTNDAMGDFTRMTPAQRRVARRFLIIPGWLMAGSRYPVHFAITHPGRSIAIAYVAAGEPYADRLGLPQNPPITDYFTRIGYNEGLKIGDKIQRTTSLSPINTPYDIAMALLGRNDSRAIEYANPLLKAGFHTASGENRFGREVGYADGAWDNLQTIVPNIGFIKDMVKGEPSTGTYPGDATRLGRLLRELGVVPIEIKQGASDVARAMEDWEAKVALAEEMGTPIPPGVEDYIAAKGTWEEIKAALPDDTSEEDMAKAKFELLVSLRPETARYREAAYAAFAHPEKVASADRNTDKLLGWDYLSEMSSYANAEARAREAEAKGLPREDD